MKLLHFAILVDDVVDHLEFDEKLTQCLLEGESTDCFVYDPKFAIANIDLTHVETGIPDCT